MEHSHWRRLRQLQRARFEGPQLPLRDLEYQGRFLAVCLDTITPNTDLARLSQAVVNFSREADDGRMTIVEDHPSRSRPTLPVYSEGPYQSRTEQLPSSALCHGQSRAYDTTHSRMLVPTMCTGHRQAYPHASLAAEVPTSGPFQRFEGGSTEPGRCSGAPTLEKEYHETMEGCDAFELPSYHARNRLPKSSTLVPQQTLLRNSIGAYSGDENGQNILYNPHLNQSTLRLARCASNNRVGISESTETSKSFSNFEGHNDLCYELSRDEYLLRVASRFVIDPRNQLAHRTASEMGLLQRKSGFRAFPRTRRHTLPDIPDTSVNFEVQEPPTEELQRLSLDIIRTDELDSATHPRLSTTLDDPAAGFSTEDASLYVHSMSPAIQGNNIRSRGQANGLLCEPLLQEHVHGLENDSKTSQTSTSVKGDIRANGAPSEPVLDDQSMDDTTTVSYGEDQLLDQEISRYEHGEMHNELEWVQTLQEQLESRRTDGTIELALPYLRQSRARQSALAISVPSSHETSSLMHNFSGDQNSSLVRPVDCGLHLRGGSVDVVDEEYHHAVLQLIEQQDREVLLRLWIQRFINSRGNEYFCDVDEEYLTDRFNLTGLNTEVQYYQYALDLITDVFDLECDDDMREQIEKSARHLYGLVHARYIVTTRGQQKMMEKYKVGDFGKCPRVACEGQNLLPMGQNDTANASAVKLYCSRCEDLYNPKSSRHAAIDGAYFGTSFHNIFFQVYPNLAPQKSQKRYEPRIYGFRVHASAALARWQHRAKEQLKDRLGDQGIDTGFEGSEDSEMEGSGGEEGEDGIDDMFEGRR